MTVQFFKLQIFESTYHCWYQAHADLYSSSFIISRKKSMFSVLFTSCYKICNNTYKLCFIIAPKIKKEEQKKIFWIIHLIQRNSFELYFVQQRRKDIHNMVNFAFISFDCIFQHSLYSKPENNDWWRDEKSMPIHCSWI